MLSALLPAEVLNRPKMGFSIPLANWFRRELKGSFERQIFAEQSFIGGFFDTQPIRQWWAQHQRERRRLRAHTMVTSRP